MDTPTGSILVLKWSAVTDASFTLETWELCCELGRQWADRGHKYNKDLKQMEDVQKGESGVWGVYIHKMTGTIMGPVPPRWGLWEVLLALGSQDVPELSYSVLDPNSTSQYQIFILKIKQKSHMCNEFFLESSGIPPPSQWDFFYSFWLRWLSSKSLFSTLSWGSAGDLSSKRQELSCW